MTKQSVLNSVEEVLEDIRQGKVVIVVDDEDRENEGDFIVAAEKITPEIVNFMLHNGRGVMCAPLTEDRCKELELDMQVADNTSLLGTPFTVSIDLLGEGCTTGVSAHDRAATIRALVDPKTKPSDLGRPGHIFPLRARNRGVLRRPGHTEAVVDLTRMAGLQTGGALIEIMNEDGTMARLPQLVEILKNNWEGNQVLQMKMINEGAKFGNGQKEAGNLACEMVNYFVERVEAYNSRYGDLIFSPCIATFSWIVNIGKRIGASADGRMSKDPIAANMSPVLSRDVSGPMAALNSYPKLSTDSLE